MENCPPIKYIRLWGGKTIKKGGTTDQGKGILKSKSHIPDISSALFNDSTQHVENH